MPVPARTVLLAVCLALLGLALPACHNVCQQAAQKMDECLQQRCAAHHDDPLCQTAASPQAHVGDCTEQAAAQAERVQSLSCDDIFGGAALGTGAGTGSAAP